jgi:hypothetical protein
MPAGHRSAGEGPGLVGAPGLAIGGVILLGLVSAGLTLAYVRFSGGSASTASSAGTRPTSAALPGRVSAATGAGQSSTTVATTPPVGATGPRTPDPPGSDRGGSG